MEKAKQMHGLGHLSTECPPCFPRYARTPYLCQDWGPRPVELEVSWRQKSQAGLKTKRGNGYAYEMWNSLEKAKETNRSEGWEV